MAYRCLRTRFQVIPKPPYVSRYHDYVRVASKGSFKHYISAFFAIEHLIAGSIRVPLSSPNVIGIVNSRGNRGCVQMSSILLAFLTGIWT